MHHTPTVLVTVTGVDRPGVTRDMFTACSKFPVRVVDLQQLVVRGHLILAMLIEASESDVDLEEIRASLVEAAENLGLSADTSVGQPEQPQEESPRFRISVMGAPLCPNSVADIAGIVAAHEGNIDHIHRIADYPVTAIAFEGTRIDPDCVRRDLAELSASRGIDIAVQHVTLETRGQHLVVMDVDSTVIQNEVIDMLAELSGKLDEVAAITERAMAGEIDFSESLRARVALIEGLPAEALDQVRAQITLTPGARTLCRTLKRLGYRIALVSGGFTSIIAPIAAELGVDEVRANELEIVDGKLTGRVVGAIVDRLGKRAALEEFAEKYQIPRERTIAIGDGANDIDMIEAAGLGIAFNAKPITRAAADTSVSVPFLDSVLFLLGITRQEVEAADKRDGVATPRI